MQAADDVHLRQLRAHLGEHFVEALLVGVVVSRFCGEIAKHARQHAEVGGVDLPVDHELDPVPVARAVRVIRHAAERRKIGRAEDGEPFLRAEPVAAKGLLPDGINAGSRKAIRGLVAIRALQAGRATVRCIRVDDGLNDAI